MPSFFLALISAALATLGGREAVRVARLSAALGGGGALLVAGWLACAIACMLAARLGAGATGAPWLAAAGGALGSGAVFTAAWSMGGEWEARMPIRLLRYGVAALLLVAALATGLTARGLL